MCCKLLLRVAIYLLLLLPDRPLLVLTSRLIVSDERPLWVGSRLFKGFNRMSAFAGKQTFGIFNLADCGKLLRLSSNLERKDVWWPWSALVLNISAHLNQSQLDQNISPRVTNSYGFNLQDFFDG